MTDLPGPGEPVPSGQPARPRTWLGRVLQPVFWVLAALYVVFEEWIWNTLTRAMAWVASKLPWPWLEARLRRLPPYAAMAVFLVPWLLLLPFKVLVVWLLATGRFGTSVLVYIAAKVIGTAVLVRLFALTRESLLQIGWFRALHGWFIRLRDRLYAYVRSLRAWQAVKAWTGRVRDALRAFWRRVRAWARA